MTCRSSRNCSAPARRSEQNYETNLLARIAAQCRWTSPLTKLGADIEARRRREGVYPPKEIYIASPDDSQRCFQEYLMTPEALQHDGNSPTSRRNSSPAKT